MPKLPDLPDIAPNQVQTAWLDFGKQLPAGVTLTGSPTINVSVRTGTAADPTPEARIKSGPVIGTNPTSNNGSGATNAAIGVQFFECNPWTTYVVEAVCQRSDGDTIEGFSHMRCVPPN